MNENSELKTMLTRAAGSTRPTTDADVIADLARGRSALRHRRFILLTNGALALAVVGGLVVAGTSGAFDNSSDPVTPSASAPSAPSTDVSKDISSAIAFVAYTGAQPEGFTVATVPDGWKIQGVNEYRLTIAPPSGADEFADSFVGKLVVMLQSQDEDPNPAGDPIKVGDLDGVVLRPGDGFASIHYNDGNGHMVVVQWPTSTGWSDRQVADFAAGVKVTSEAKAGRG
jgi:hypothetical protein